MRCSGSSTGLSACVSAANARSADTMNLNGRFSSPPRLCSKASELKSTRSIALMSPRVRVNSAATAPTTLSAGSALTKRRQSLPAMKRAVLGCPHTISTSRSRSFLPPPAGITSPSTCLGPSSCQSGLKKDSPAFSTSSRIRSKVQPLRQRAASSTSCCV